MFIDAYRIDNAIHHLSPTFGGFRLQGMLALGEGTMDRYQGVKGTYAAGPLTAAISYKRSKALAVAPSGKSTVNKILDVAGNYKFSTFTVFAGAQRGEELTAGPASQIQIGTLTLPGLATVATTQKACTIGPSMPLGQTELMANYTHAQYRNATGAGVTLGRAGVGATYFLSKRTAIYGTVSAARGPEGQRQRAAALPARVLRHSF